MQNMQYKIRKSKNRRKNNLLLLKMPKIVLKMSKVTTIFGLFQSCTKLTELNLSKWDVSSLKDIGSFAYNCNNLKTLNISGWRTSKLTTIYSAFQSCKNIDINSDFPNQAYRTRCRLYAELYPIYRCSHNGSPRLYSNRYDSKNLSFPA